MLRKLGVIFLTLLAITPALTAAEADQATTIIPAPNVTRYNSIANFNPVTRVVHFYNNASLNTQIHPNLSWIPNGQGTVIKTSAKQGIYAVCQNHCKSIASVVVSAKPGAPTSRTVVIVPDFTWQAYNSIGGGSMYKDGLHHPNGKRYYSFGVDQTHPYGQHEFSKVNINRPLDVNGVYPSFQLPSVNPIHFLNKLGHRVDVIAQSALANYHYNLNDYAQIVLYGHDEYWTQTEIDQIQTAVKQGSSLLNLSANTGYRLIKFNGQVISFDRSVKPADILQRPTNATNPVIGLLGLQYMFLPLGDKLSILKKKFTQHIETDLENQGFPSTVPANQVAGDVSDIELATKSPLFAGVKLDSNGFIMGTHGLQTVEVDGVPLNNQGQISRKVENYLQLQNADILGRSWVGYRVATKAPFTRPIGTIVAKFFGKGRVISIGALGWIERLVTGNKNIRRLTANFYRSLATSPQQATSTTHWSSTPIEKQHMLLATFSKNPHEQIIFKTACIPTICRLIVKKNELRVSLTGTVAQLPVTEEIVGAPGYKVLVRPKVSTHTFTF